MRAKRSWAGILLGLVFVAGFGGYAGWELRCALGEQTADDSWQLVQVPSVWTNAPAGPYGQGKGYAWYRCLVQVPSEWEGQPLELVIEPIDDAREVYFNGHSVGTAGEFPPQYRSGLGEPGQYAVPAAEVRFGEQNLVAIRVYQNAGRAGFNVAPPTLFGGNEAIRLEGKWEYRAGDAIAWSTESPLDAHRERVTYSERLDAEIARESLTRIEGDAGPLDPGAALAAFEVAEDLKLEQVLADPHIGQPLSIKFDPRGRLWVVEYLQYPDPAGLKMLSRDKFLRSVYDKVPPAPPHHFRGQDRISIHEDTDGDGTYDEHKTFVDGLSLVSSFAIGRGGVWVLNPPYLLFYPDRDGDDRPDGDPEVHLEGFGIEDSHSIANSLRWGPDGWLYAAQGSTVTGNIRRPGSDEPAVHSMGQLIWRYHPEQRKYEIFAEGGGNAFGVEIDAQGRIYSGHNGGNTRGFHYVQGGYYQKGFEKHGSLSNPYTFGYFLPMKHHDVPRFTHTFVIYEATTLPQAYWGNLFGVGPLQSHLVRSEVLPEGSSRQTRDLGHPLTSSDSWFRPVDIQLGPDGGIYIADFYEQRIDHASHYQGRVSRQTGRIYRLTAKEAQPIGPFDLAALETPALIEVLKHPNRWHRQTALRVLGDRRDPAAIPLLREAVLANDGQFALESLWALHLSGGLKEDLALQLLGHRDPHVRLWTVRLACDDGEASSELVGRMAELAGSEPHVEVRSQLASSARRLPAADALAVVRQLLKRSEDLEDPHLPLLVWWAVEAKADSDPELILAMMRDRALYELPMVEQHLLTRLMRRYAQAGSRKDLLVCAQLLQQAPDERRAQRLMKGLEEGFSGRSISVMPPELLEAMARFGGGSLPLRLRHGDEAALQEALTAIQSGSGPLRLRLDAIEILGQIDVPQCIPVLLEVLRKTDDGQVRVAILSSLKGYAQPEIAAEVLNVYPNLDVTSREAAHGLLASRQPWARALVDAVEAGRVRAEDVSLPIVRQILLHNQDDLAARVRKHWGAVEGETTEQMRQRIAELKELILAGSGNPYDGRPLFLSTCGKCHVLFEEGGRIGPDLTSYQRDDLDGMLLHVVNPSAQIREGYETFVVLTTDGRALTGFVADEDNQVVVLRTADGLSSVIEREEIDDMRAAARSLMPEALLDPLEPQQIRDLFAYLRSSQPLP